MRRFLALALLVAAVLVQSANARTVDPARLVLKQSDVPASYERDAKQSGRRTVAADAAGYPALAAKYETWGRVAGYQVRFAKGEDAIVSRADVFRRGAGARKMYEWYLAQENRPTQVRMRHAPVALGDEGVLYSLTLGRDSLALVIWRDGRVLSIVGGSGIVRTRVLALARTQQRRVVAALR